MVCFAKMVSMTLMRGHPKVEGGCPGTTSSTSVIAPTPTQPADLPSPFEVQEIPLEEATRKAPEASSKRLTKAPIGHKMTRYIRGMPIPQLAVDLYTMSSEVLMDRVAKIMVLQLVDSKSQLRNIRTQVHEMENELLKLTRAMDALRVDLPKQAIEDYKKSPGFEMGLIRMGWVSLEYGYQLALARLQA
ncbi:hypothetical protein B296_00041947 [Ensete ventricosum]|uniref:Uncharacterized protein n=1 Tax=Ensete ventricosum TaxID=4639 RepID=A0A426Y5F9_ENSVE|nr:hypothetical protein B296_00041947 [Ensete ventricosum]